MWEAVIRRCDYARIQGVRTLQAEGNAARMPSPQPPRTPFGVNIIGYVTGNLGLGVATRNTIRMLKGLGVPIALTDVDPGSNRIGSDATYASLLDETGEPAPHPITIFHMNPPALAEQAWLHRAWVNSDRITACVPFWELPILPRSWVPVLDAMDMILVPTRFIEEAVRKALPDAYCVHYRQTAFVPSEIPADRHRWRIPRDAVAFVTSFDILSDFQRKNPEAVIRAFYEAFPERANVRLVIKINSTADSRITYADRLNELLALAATDERILVVDEVLSYEDVLSLYASCDVLVSLHRSEGLGLSLLEAMSLGKAVITTAWSGNMDFTTQDNACLVGYELIPVDSSHPSYSADVVGEGCVWAEPSVADAARSMRALADDSGLRERLGARARSDVQASRAVYERGELVDALREALATDSAIWLRHADKRARLLRITRGTMRSNIRRLGGKVLRRLGLR